MTEKVNNRRRLSNLIGWLRRRLSGMTGRNAFLSLVGLIGFAILLFVGIQALLGPKEAFGTLALPYIQNFDDVDLRRWFTGGGVWTLREQRLAQTTGGEKSAQIHIPSKLPVDQPYHFSVYLTLPKNGRAAGVVFNSQYPKLTEKQHRVYISRPEKGQAELVAGYMDDSGSFVPQAQVPLSLDTQDYRLDLFVYATSYLVQLNGQRLIDKRPLFYNNGLVGFYVLGPANFDNVRIIAADNPDPGDMVYTSDFDQNPGGAGWVPFSGDWRIIGKQMVQTNATTFEAGIGYETSTFQNYLVQASFQLTQGNGAGILFNMPSPYQVNGAQVVRYSDETDALVWGSFDEKGVFVRQGYRDVQPPANVQHQLQIYSGENSYDVFLDGSLIVRDASFGNNQGHIGLMTARGSAAFSIVEVFPIFGQQVAGRLALTGTVSAPQATGSPKPTAQRPITQTRPGLAATPSSVITPTPSPNRIVATPLPGSSGIVADGSAKPYKGVFEGTLSAAGWRVLSGEWVFANGSMNQNNQTVFDASSVYVRNAYRNYSLRVTLTHVQGNGGGVLFNMPYNSRLEGAHMVRYSDRRKGAIIWGYYDAAGKFVGQGYANVTEAANTPHTFTITSGETTYSVYLDGELVAREFPLQQNYGYFGLITAQSTATFNEVEVNAMNTLSTTTFNSTDGFSNLRIVNGKWTTEGNIIRQDVTEPADYILNTGIFASEYTLEAQVTLPDIGEAGGGVVFHMADRSNRNNAMVARLIKGGTGVFWGSYNATGVFNGQGSANIAAKSKTFQLKMVVRGNRFDLSINGQAVVKDILVPRTEGWIGLVAYGGPVTFKDVKIAVGKPSE